MSANKTNQNLHSSVIQSCIISYSVFSWELTWEFSFSLYLQVRGQIQDLLRSWNCGYPMSLMISLFGNLSSSFLLCFWNLHCILLGNRAFFNVDVSYFGKSYTRKPRTCCFLDFLLTCHDPNVFCCCRGVKDHKCKLRLMIDKRQGDMCHRRDTDSCPQHQPKAKWPNHISCHGKFNRDMCDWLVVVVVGRGVFYGSISISGS